MAYDLDTHRFLHWNLNHNPDGDPDEDFHYLDIAKMLSEVNRRTYRQGMSYDVANVIFHDSDDDETFIKVCTAPNTWPTQAAWQLGFRAWMQQQRAATRALSIEAGKYADFKIFLNPDHVDDTDKAVFVDCEDNTAPSGDWDYSQYKVPVDGSDNPSDCKIVLMGAGTGFPNATRASLLREFEKVLNVPQEDPAVPNVSNSLYAMLSPDASDMEVVQAVMDDLAEFNDFPPYSKDVILGAGGTAGAGVPIAPWIIRECCVPGNGAHMAAVAGFTAPCGLVCIETTNPNEDNKIGVTLELVPGEYKGVSARPMRGGGF